jgi:DNA-binding LacI/PurR family transcriptional regulator
MGSRRESREGDDAMTDQGASIGLAIRHTHDRDPVASAIVEAIAGPLVAAGMRFITRSVDDEESELRTYRHWARVGGIAGVIVLGTVDDDPRIRLLRQIDLPFVALARTDLEVDYPAVTVDPSAAAHALTAYLGGHDAQRWVYVTDQQQPEPLVEHGPASETPEDRRAFEIVRTSDVVREAVAIGTVAEQPTVLILDGDRDAVAVLEALEETGAAVPETVSLICWSDSLVCQSASRPITAIDRHGREIGELLGTAAIDAVNGDGARVAAPAPLVVERETT